MRKVLLTGLKERGWIVKADLKIPHASKDRDRLWFKTQAVYLATGMGKDIGDAHSISSDMREYATVEDLLRDVERHREATPQETEPSRDEWSYQRRAKVARYLESVAKLVGDPSASKLLGDIAEEARGLEGPSPEYAKTIAERLRAAAIGEGAETFSILRRAAWGLDHGSRGPTSAELWAETREGTPEEEFEARRAEAARIEAELDRLRARFPSKRRNAVREMVRDAIRKVRESCISPAEMWPQSADSGVKCDEARDELRAALAARARSLSQDQGDIFTGFQAPRDVAAAAAVVKDIEALSRRLETPEAESFKVGDEVVGADGRTRRHRHRRAAERQRRRRARRRHEHPLDALGVVAPGSGARDRVTAAGDVGTRRGHGCAPARAGRGGRVRGLRAASPRRCRTLRRRSGRRCGTPP